MLNSAKLRKTIQGNGDIMTDSKTYRKWLITAVCITFLGLSACSPSGERRPGDTDVQASEVWHDYPFKSHYQKVGDHNLHYIDEGDPEGQVFLFLHGNPTSSYLWRNVVPIVAQSGRAIAVDNIGFGMSDQPNIGYTFAEHSEYIDGFIAEMGLKDVILVIHDWGSALGFDYAKRNSDNVKGIVFMEAIMQVAKMDDMPPEVATAFKGMRTPVVGWFTVMVQNAFIEQGLPGSVVRELSEDEMNAYREPFPTIGSRKPVLVWPREVPFDGEPADVAARVTSFEQWLPTSTQPKLLFHVDRGLLVGKDLIVSMQAEWTNLETRHLGDGLHFLQEDHPEAIGQAIVEWHATNFGDTPETPTEGTE